MWVQPEKHPLTCQKLLMSKSLSIAELLLAFEFCKQASNSHRLIPVAWAHLINYHNSWVEHRILWNSACSSHLTPCLITFLLQPGKWMILPDEQNQNGKSLDLNWPLKFSVTSGAVISYKLQCICLWNQTSTVIYLCLIWWLI